MLNSTVDEKYQSPFYEERKREWETMMQAKLIKKAWVLMIERNQEGDRKVFEEMLKEWLEHAYDAKEVKFDVEKKRITFEMEFEELAI